MSWFRRLSQARRRMHQSKHGMDFHDYIMLVTQFLTLGRKIDTSTGEGRDEYNRAVRRASDRAYRRFFA